MKGKNVQRKTDTVMQCLLERDERMTQKIIDDDKFCCFFLNEKQNINQMLVVSLVLSPLTQLLLIWSNQVCLNILFCVLLFINCCEYFFFIIFGRTGKFERYGINLKCVTWLLNISVVCILFGFTPFAFAFSLSIDYPRIRPRTALDSNLSILFPLLKSKDFQHLQIVFSRFLARKTFKWKIIKFHFEIQSW